MYDSNERGSALIEALIAISLVIILLNGSGYLSSRAIASHTQQQLLNIAIAQMRASIRSDDICAQAPTIELPNNITLTATAQGCDATTVTINGLVISNVPTPTGLSVDSEILGGQVVVGGTWRN